MKIYDYIKDKIMLLLFQAVAVIISFVYLKICGMKPDQLFFIYVTWFLILIVWIGIGWYRRKKFFDEIFHIMKELEKPYLISEIMPFSYGLEDKLYRQILSYSNKSVVDAVHHMEREQSEYKDFIENWIHEVKLPITAMNLICDNVKNEETRRIKIQLSLLENDVEKALFYARSDRVYQDYFIRQIRLDQVVYDVIERNQMYLRMNQMGVEVQVGEVSVYCDDKWLAFILSQLFINAVKYRRESGSRMIIQAAELDGRTILSVVDNGIGIKASELGRIFQKGFTGTNGRQNRQSTGIGLYLCKKLCRKLDMGIEIQSEEGKYTRVLLGFPDGSSHFGRGESKEKS